MRTDITFIIPILNEPQEWVHELAVKTLDAARLCSMQTVEFILFDGGSSPGAVKSTIDIGTILKRRGASVSVVGAGVCAKPNKNLGIAYAARRSNARLGVILDADWGSQTHLRCDDFALLLGDETGFTVPEPLLQAGRDNHLIGAPILRTLYPQLYASIKTPFPGAFAAPVELLQRAVETSYHYDWGGELDLLLNCSTGAHSVRVPKMPFREVRHRPMVSKMADAYQMFRAALLRIEPYATSPSIDLLRSEISSEHRLLVAYCEQHLGEDASSLINQISDLLAQGRPQEAYDRLSCIAYASNAPELQMVADMAVAPLAKLILNQTVILSCWPEHALRYKDMELRSVSMLVDVIFISLLPHLRNRSDHGLCRPLEFDLGDQSPYSADFMEYCEVMSTGIDLLHLSDQELLRYSQLHMGSEPSRVRTEALIQAFASIDFAANI